MQVVENKMKKILLLFFIFTIFSILIISCPIITIWDKEIIIKLQELLNNLPLWLPLLPDCKLYSIMIAFPIIIGGILFFKNKLYTNILFLGSIPLGAFLINLIIKPLIHRPRPAFEMQLGVHPDSFSYVSSHSLVSFCLWGIVIYFISKYCKNIYLKAVTITISILWILFVGLSRVWIGVHNPTDVIGAYLLGALILSVYIELIDRSVINE